MVLAKSLSGGPVDSVFCAKVKNMIPDGVSNQERVDGIYLSLHGAMGVQGMLDPEGDLTAGVQGMFNPEGDLTAAVGEAASPEPMLIINHEQGYDAFPAEKPREAVTLKVEQALL